MCILGSWFLETLGGLSPMVRGPVPLKTFLAFIDVNGAGLSTISDSRSEMHVTHPEIILWQKDTVSRGSWREGAPPPEWRVSGGFGSPLRGATPLAGSPRGGRPGANGCCFETGLLVFPFCRRQAYPPGEKRPILLPNGKLSHSPGESRANLLPKRKFSHPLGEMWAFLLPRQ